MSVKERCRPSSRLSKRSLRRTRASSKTSKRKSTTRILTRRRSARSSTVSTTSLTRALCRQLAAVEVKRRITVARRTREDVSVSLLRSCRRLSSASKSSLRCTRSTVTRTTAIRPTLTTSTLTDRRLARKVAAVLPPARLAVASVPLSVVTRRVPASPRHLAHILILRVTTSSI